MKEIILNTHFKRTSRQGFTTLVDDEDYEWLNQWKWSLSGRVEILYARAIINGVETRMHRLIMKAKKGQIIDHINRNGLDNRKINLRFCTYSQNNINRNKCGSGKYRGIHFRPERTIIHFREKNIYTYISKPKWQAVICINKKFIYLGCYEKEIDAAKAYNEAAKKHHGEYAMLNIIEDE